MHVYSISEQIIHVAVDQGSPPAVELEREEKIKDQLETNSLSVVNDKVILKFMCAIACIEYVAWVIVLS